MLRLVPTRARRLSHRTPWFAHRTPWFVSPQDDLDADVGHPHVPHLVPAVPAVPAAPAAPIPHDAPAHLRTLHTQLCTLPFLDASSLRIMRRIEPPAAPPLPFMRTRGSRRKRGGTDAGVGIDMPSHGIWTWVVLAQVKEGTERKGSIGSVLYAVRKTLRELAAQDPSLALPPHRKQPSTDGWAMLDVGDFAVHIVTRTAMEKWFQS